LEKKKNDQLAGGQENKAAPDRKVLGQDTKRCHTERTCFSAPPRKKLRSAVKGFEKTAEKPRRGKMKDHSPAEKEDEGV